MNNNGTDDRQYDHHLLAMPKGTQKHNLLKPFFSYKTSSDTGSNVHAKVLLRIS